MVDEWWLMTLMDDDSDGWWLWWLMTDGWWCWWLMTDGWWCWWLMTDGWWLMVDDWLLMTLMVDYWWLMTLIVDDSDGWWLWSLVSRKFLENSKTALVSRSTSIMLGFVLSSNSNLAPDSPSTQPQPPSLHLNVKGLWITILVCKIFAKHGTFMYVWGYSVLIFESCNCSHLKRYINLFHMPFCWLKTKILVLNP